ncbi:hypothetical protein ACI2JA_03890 [Alkalihalobacillus sp. NPDC078783]
MKVQVYSIPFGYQTNKVLRSNTLLTFKDRGSIEVDRFSCDELFHLCNWSCWTSEKPRNINSDIEVANSDVIFHDPVNDVYHLALPFGWEVRKTKSELADYLYSL